MIILTIFLYVIAMNDSAPLQYMSFWEYNPAEFANWTNYAFTTNLTLIEEGNLLGINHLYEVSSIFFEQLSVACLNASGSLHYPLVLKSNYNEEWNKNLPLLSELYANNSIFGFFMGDELVWQGLNPNDLNIAIQTIRANFSDCIIYYNDAKMVFYPGFNFCQLAVNYSKISKYLDWISVDDYHIDGPNNSFVSGIQSFYEQHIYPTMNVSHQYALFVPGSFASNCNAECNVSCYDQMCSMDAYNLYQWGLKDEQLIGFMGFHWKFEPECAAKNEIGTKSMNITKSAWYDIGRKIITNSDKF